jgi:hypothetical protein
VDLVELVNSTHSLLTDAHIDHAFGGALALAYYAEPRATLDVDTNVFVAVSRAAEVARRFEAIGLRSELPIDAWSPIAGVRLAPTKGIGRLDLFFSIDDRYDQIAGRVRWFPFGSAGVMLPFLAPEDLVMFKLSFGRDKDWIDLAAMAASGIEVDLDVVEALLIALRGPSLYPRMARARSLFEA